MAAIGGSIESVSYAGRDFAVAADSDASIKTGGFENEVMSNGNGTVRLVKTRVAHAITGVQIEIDHSRGDLLFLQERANSKVFEVLAITLVDGSVYQGISQITGELSGSTQSATVTVSFGGPSLTLQ